jgi:pimeloyl-ACP methyl ester carboxylesterase
MAYAYFRSVIREVVERYLDCGNPRSGSARIRCPDCLSEHLLTFSCKTRGFCPSCHAKRVEEWVEWVREILAPVLVISGDGDIIKLEHILDIYQNIPKAQLFIMPGATHFMLREEYSLFNQIAERFLDNPFKRPTTK